MAYHSISFLGIFLPLLLAAYFLMPGVKSRQIIIFSGNIIFYYHSGLSGLFVILFTSVVVYVSSRMIDRIYTHFDREKGNLSPKEQAALFSRFKRKSKKVLLCALMFIVGILAYIKIGKYFQWEETGLRHFSFGKILVPLGISYYTFSSAGYLLDVYWRKAKCEHNYFKLVLCMTFFPYITEGPICKYQNILKQLDNLPGFQYENFCYGLQLLLWGLFKKLVVADRLALYVNSVLSDLSGFAGTEVFLAVIFGAIQLYADFSGCMDIVCGIAQTMGITLEDNFNHPFFSKNAAEFWRRWHITLGAWFRDYIYLPIAVSPRFLHLTSVVRKKYGNTVGQAFSTGVPLITVWVLTGIWHGSGKSYLAWGIYWGGILILSNLLTPQIERICRKCKIPIESFGLQIFRIFRTFVLFCIGRTIVMAGSLHGCLRLWSAMLKSAKLWVLFDGSLYTHGLDQKNFHAAVWGILLMLCMDFLQERIHIRETLAKQPLIFRWLVYYGSFVLVLIFGMYGPSYDAGSFLYAGF